MFRFYITDKSIVTKQSVPKNRKKRTVNLSSLKNFIEEAQKNNSYFDEKKRRKFWDAGEIFLRQLEESWKKGNDEEAEFI